MRGSLRSPPESSSGGEHVTPERIMTVLPMLDVPMLGAGDAPNLVVVMVDVRDPGNAGTVFAPPMPASVGSFLVVSRLTPTTQRRCGRRPDHSSMCPFRCTMTPSRWPGTTGRPGIGPGRRWSTTARTTPTSSGTPRARCSRQRVLGLPQGVIDAVDGSVIVPMQGQAESLNVAVACAVVCFEALRQRRRGAHT